MRMNGPVVASRAGGGAEGGRASGACAERRRASVIGPVGASRARGERATRVRWRMRRALVRLARGRRLGDPRGAEAVASLGAHRRDARRCTRSRGMTRTTSPRRVHLRADAAVRAIETASLLVVGGGVQLRSVRGARCAGDGPRIQAAPAGESVVRLECGSLVAARTAGARRLMKNSLRAADDPERPSAAPLRLAVFLERGSAASPRIWPPGSPSPRSEFLISLLAQGSARPLTSR